MDIGKGDRSKSAVDRDIPEREPAQGDLLLESNVLIYSDEPTTSRIWALLVSDLRCRPIVVASVPLAISAVEKSSPELIVIDITYRDVNALEVCEALREHTTNPILLLTPVNNESHTLEAYRAGVDECIIKPVSPAMFAAKASVWLRRAGTAPLQIMKRLTVGNLTLEPARLELIWDDDNGKQEKLQLAGHQFRILHLLLSHPNQTFSTEEIFEQVWGVQKESDSTVVKDLIHRLRRKIESDLEQPCDIQSVPGGYMFRL
ncbi:MAG TPA: response regulator transcription factor [Anaerolineales bacterium]